MFGHGRGNGGSNSLGTADAVVIGSGAFGASVAYHLASAGARVALLDRHALGSQTSPRAAGNAAQARESDTLARLAIDSTEAIRRFSDETGEPLVYHESGSLTLGYAPEWAANFAERVERGRRLGVAWEIIDGAAARACSPLLEPGEPAAVLHTPGDLYLEPGQLPLAYARAAARIGARLLPQTAVTDILLRAGAVEGVMTERGSLAAPLVIDAAGGWTRLLAEQAGLRVPLVPMRHQLLITEPLAGVVASQPIVRFIDERVYLRPCDGGLLLGGYESDPLIYDMPAQPPDFQVRDMRLDIGVLERFITSVAPRVPALRGAPLREHRGGLPTLTPDGHPLLGPTPGVAGFFVASGCCVGGLSISPAVGAITAAWALTGQPPSDIDPATVALDRFGAAYADEERLLAACLREYNAVYGAAPDA